MWKRGREELSYLGFCRESWIKAWQERIDRGHAWAFGTHAILGIDCEDEIATAFQASESFESPGVGSVVTKAIRRQIPLLMSQVGTNEFTTYSLCVDPGAAKWFRLLGLIEDTNYQGPRCGPYQLRRFVRRA